MTKLKKKSPCQFFDGRYLSKDSVGLGKILRAFTRQIIFLTFPLFSITGYADIEQFPFKPCFEKSAKKFNLDPNFLAAVASVESSFDPKAESSSGAVGLMQIKWPQTAKELGVLRKADLFNPCSNIDAGARYLAKLFDRFDSKLFALAAYYQGPTKIGREGHIPSQSVSYIEKVLREELLITNLSELARSGKCRLLDFQTVVQKNHHPKNRLKEASIWLQKNFAYCSTPELLRLSNRLPELMGTADAKGELKLLIYSAINNKSHKK